ncbi:MAG: ABC transporter permease [Acidobacteriota bacterium]|nr:ABC transporter permease [Acidobacteriota bacterium]
MSSVSLANVVRSEWIKFRSVRSTAFGFAVFVVLTVGLSVLITSLIHSHWDQMNAVDKLTFDPVSTSLGGVSLAQFAVGVIGSLFVTSEYSSGSIRSTLAAVPVRRRIVAAKLIVLSAAMIVVSEVVCFAAFFVGQSIYSGMIPASTDSLSNAGVLRAVLLGGLYLTMLAALGLGLGLILRQSPATISTFTGLVLLIPLIIFFLPTSLQDTLTKYEPSALGRGMMATTTPELAFGPWAATAVLALYVGVVLAVGTALFARRDA